MLSGKYSAEFKLTDLEKERIRKAGNQFDAKLKKLIQKHRESMTELLKERDEKIKSILSDQRKASYDRQFGKPFWFFLQSYVTENLDGWPDAEKE